LGILKAAVAGHYRDTVGPALNEYSMTILVQTARDKTKLQIAHPADKEYSSLANELTSWPTA
jgi:hypothetical protein